MRSGVVWGVFLAVAAGLLFALASCTGNKATAQADAEAVREGQWVYTDNCSECHENSLPDLVKQPPNLHGVFSSKALPSGAPATDQQVRETIIHGLRTMPAFDQRLKKDDIENVIKYLHSLK
jgi:mono/diheme cytochrome c family protein